MADPIRMTEAPFHTSGPLDVPGVPYVAALISQAMTSPRAILAVIASALGLGVLLYFCGLSLAALYVALVAGAATVFNVFAATIRDLRDLRPHR